MAALDPALCAEGHVKFDPVTGSVGIRTEFSDVDYPDLSWLIATISSGAINKNHAFVQHWEDTAATGTVDGGEPGTSGDNVIDGGTP